MLRPRLPVWPISQNRDEPTLGVRDWVRRETSHCVSFDASAYAPAIELQTPGAVLHSALVLNLVFTPGGVLYFT